jgi:voltage-gated potassium channel
MPSRRARRLITSLRFGRFLVREFRLPLVVLLVLVFGGGWILDHFYRDEPLTYLRACYAVFALIFFESTIPFPRAWYLEPLFFLVPIIGLGAIADSLVRLGYLLFTRKQQLQEWQVMQAGITRNHIVVVGVGKVGYRIIKGLLQLQEDVVAIERNRDSPLVSELLDSGVPVIQGEARLRTTLEQANVAHAKAIILATDDDLANLDAALTAREIKPDLRVVLRMFDDTLASKVATAFALPAISTSATAAPAFITAATGRSLLAGFSLDGGETLHVADVVVAPASPLCGCRVQDVQERWGVHVIIHKRAATTTMTPAHDLEIVPHDHLVVVAPIDRIAALQKVT